MLMYLIIKKVMQLLISLASDKELLVIPETLDLKDVHPVLVDTYSLYYCDHHEIVAIIENGELLNCYAEHFMGRVKFGNDETSFKYIAHETQCLAINEVVEVIKVICHYRETPALWIN